MRVTGFAARSAAALLTEYRLGRHFKIRQLPKSVKLFELVNKLFE